MMWGLIQRYQQSVLMNWMELGIGNCEAGHEIIILQIGGL
jgi:hypothetical protein